MTEKRRATGAMWRQRIEEQIQSGQTVAAFCRERGIPRTPFFSWRRKLAAEAAGFVAARVAEPEAAPPGGAIEVGLRGGRRLRVEQGFDRELLAELIAVLETLA